MSEAKKQLVQLSGDLKTAMLLVQLPSQYQDCIGMNDMLMVYHGIQNMNCNTFHGWRKAGFKVKKGSKGFPIWSKPIKAKEAGTEVQKEDAKKTYKFFNVCYLFTEKQVEALETVEA